MWEVKALKQITKAIKAYYPTIIDKTVGKVSTFDVFFASLPTPLIQCYAKLDGFSGNMLGYLPTLKGGRGAT